MNCRACARPGQLKKRLAELEAQGLLNGVIELVPVANPLGLGQLLQGNHQGRFEAGSGKNFNRDFVELSAPVAAETRRAPGR